MNGGFNFGGVAGRKIGSRIKKEKKAGRQEQAGELPIRLRSERGTEKEKAIP